MSSREVGQTTVLVIGLSLLAFAVAGVAIDGTRAFILRRTLQNAADSASIAGAGELDETTYYSSGGRRIALEPSSASGTAESFLARRGIPARSSVEADSEGVYVVMRAESPTTFLRLIGIDTISVAVESRAEPQTELSFDPTLR
jgi:Putative Flp pilus-assembly TadE/G-like